LRAAAVFLLLLVNFTVFAQSGTVEVITLKYRTAEQVMPLLRPMLDKTGSTLAYVTSGCIKTPAAGDLATRLKVILDGLREVIASVKPDQVAIEKVFVNANPQSTLLLGQARGTAICAAVLHELQVSEYTALQVKQAVVGNGHADKGQVQDMVKRLLKLTGSPSADAADALACAICHAHGGQGLGKLATAGYRMKRGRLV